MNAIFSSTATAAINSDDSKFQPCSNGSDVVALDVEYMHLAPPPQQLGRAPVRILPAEVCLAAPDSVIAFHSFCRPGADLMQSAGSASCTILLRHSASLGA